METARNRHTSEVIEAQQLQGLSCVNPYDYICWGCEIVVIPCSYRSHNKKRPYFRPNKEHDLNCEIEVEKKYIEKAKKESIACEDVFPLSFPSKLVLKDTQSVSISTPEDSSNVKSKSLLRQSSSNNRINNKHHYTTSTIRPICRQFLNYPFDRNLSLSIPNVSGGIYQNIFWRLNEIIQYYTQQIFYAPLSWKKVADTGDYLELYLNAGKWDIPKHRYERPYTVRIHCKNWKETKKNNFLLELQSARLETLAADKLRKVDKENHKERGWVFFIGKQDKDDYSVFHVRDKRLICFFRAEMLYP